MRRFIIIGMAILLASLATISAKDLSRFLLRGYVYDKEYNLIDSVTVSLSKDNDTTAVKYKILVGNTEKNLVTGGQLRMMVQSGLGAYTLVVEKEGYEPLVKTFRITSLGEDVKYIGGMVMEKERFRELKEVVVTATRVKMVMKGDTVEYDAAAFQLNEGSMLDALVRQLPGATIDSDGVITVNGRKINELLINGKDFFKGEPKVALQNLPAYTVKNVQVYDKKADDANITHSDAKIDTREDEQNLVMDVNLKKEYNTGWMANAEAGIGTADRYRARGFGLGYTNKFRLAAFANANNVGDTDKASAAGEWGNGWKEDGLLNLKMGGLDYNYDDSKRIKARGNVTLTHEDVNSDNIVSTIQYYPTGDLFNRAVNLRDEKKNHLMTNHDFGYSGDVVYVNVRPTVDWLVRDRSYNNRTATFDRNPEETYRGEAIEDLFSRNFEGAYSKNLLTALHTLRSQHDNWLDMNLTTYVRIRPKSWRGYLSLSGTGSYYDAPMKERTLYRQTIGPLGDQDATPQESDRYRPSSTRRKNLYGNATYTYQKNFYDEKVSNEIMVNVGTTYQYNSSRNDADYFISDKVVSMDRLPGLYTPEDARRDWENTLYSKPTTKQGTVNAGIYFFRQPLAPGDSTFNASINASISLGVSHVDERLHYEKPTIMDEIVNRASNRVNPNVSFGLSSANKKRYIRFSIYGYAYTQTPSLVYLVNTVDNSDPFNVTYGNPDGLKNSTNYQGTIVFSRFSRAKHRASFYWDAHLYVNQNTVAMARTYDPATGITINKPENVDGNWHTDSYMQYVVQVGPRQQIELFGMLYGEFHRIIDYNAIMSVPEKNTVYNKHASGRFRVTYKFRQGSTIGVQTAKGWNGIRSPRESFNNIDTHTFNVSLNTNLLLPHNIEATSSLTYAIRRGFTDDVMNVDEWLWNASVSKSIMNSKLAFKLTAYDILNSVKSVGSTVNTIGRVETWKNTLPRYVLLSAAYRFDMKPKNKR